MSAIEPAASVVARGVPPARARCLVGRARPLPGRAARSTRRPGNKHWSKVGVAGLVKNPVYLGQARSGKVVKENAHEPLVTRAEFDAAQSVKKSLLTPARRLARRAGDARRARPLRRLRPHAQDHRQHRQEDRRALPGLLLHRPLRQGPLPRAGHRPRLSPRRLCRSSRCLRRSADEDGLLAQAVEASDADRGRSRAVVEAEHELDLFVNNPKLLTLLGEAEVPRGRRGAAARTR